MLMRSILPLFIFSILFHGFLQVKIGRYHGITSATLSAILVVAFIIIVGFVITHLTKWSFRNAEKIEDERLKMLRDLQESDERFRKTFETDITAVTINRLEDFAFVEVNQGLLKISGYQEEDLIGKPAIEMDFWVDNSQRDHHIDMILNHDGFDNEETLFKRKDGSTYYALVSARVIMLENIPHVLVILRDISLLKNQQMELKKAKETAENANQLKDYFIANVSHEIRTPLNAIMGFTELLLDEVKDQIPELENDYSSVIQSSGMRLLRTVDMILGLSRLQANLYEIRFSELDVVQIMQSLIKEYQLEAEMKKLTLTFESNFKSVRILSDEMCITHSVSNLIDNAIKYTHAGFVKVQLTDLPNRIEISVMDSGVGISSDYLTKIFEPFTQEDASYTRIHEGLGLGLSITKEHADMLGAKISVNSEKDVGTTFTISIPKKPLSLQK